MNARQSNEVVHFYLTALRYDWISKKLRCTTLLDGKVIPCECNAPQFYSARIRTSELNRNQFRSEWWIHSNRIVPVIRYEYF